MKIFVTGGTGVIGRRLVPILRRGGHDITAVGRSRAKWQELERQGAVPVDVDLYDFNAIAHAITGHDAVINLATHIPHSSTAMLLPWSWRENDRLRQHASAAIVDACLAAGVGRFVQESFAPVYPDCGDRWIDEATAISPVRYNRRSHLRSWPLSGSHGVDTRALFCDSDRSTVLTLCRHET